MIDKKVHKEKINNVESLILILLGMVTTILPWVLVSRSTYIYHFYPTLLFSILLITYVINVLESEKQKKWLGNIVIVLTILVFIIFFHVISGLPFGKNYSEIMQIFKGWFWVPL